MSSAAEERRQRILANAEKRLAKLRDVERSEIASELPPMAPVSIPAPTALLQKPKDEPIPVSTSAVSSTPTSLLSTITSATTMFSSLTSTMKPKEQPPEVTREMLAMDNQHLLTCLLGVFVGLLYAFYLSSHSNFFFMVYFTAVICILTSRYYLLKMKHRTNVLLSTAMLSGFRPDLMKQLVFIYTIVYDAWIVFALYFVSFCFTHVFCSLFSS